jgi:hypothetical protein
MLAAAAASDERLHTQSECCHHGDIVETGVDCGTGTDRCEKEGRTEVVRASRAGPSRANTQAVAVMVAAVRRANGNFELPLQLNGVVGFSTVVR